MTGNHSEYYNQSPIIWPEYKVTEKSRGLVAGWRPWGGWGVLYALGGVPHFQRKFFWLQVKNAGFYAFYCEKTTCGQKLGPAEGGSVDPDGWRYKMLPGFNSAKHPVNSHLAYDIIMIQYLYSAMESDATKRKTNKIHVYIHDQLLFTLSVVWSHITATFSIRV